MTKKILINNFKLFIEFAKENFLIVLEHDVLCFKDNYYMKRLILLLENSGIVLMLLMFMMFIAIRNSLYNHFLYNHNFFNRSIPIIITLNDITFCHKDSNIDNIKKEGYSSLAIVFRTVRLCTYFAADSK